LVSGRGGRAAGDADDYVAHGDDMAAEALVEERQFARAKLRKCLLQPSRQLFEVRI
jgi:hypothetical protein